MYHIATKENWSNAGMTIFNLKKRLSDFKADDDEEYIVFRSKKEMQNASGYIPVYIGTNGKLKKSKTKFVISWSIFGLDDEEEWD